MLSRIKNKWLISIPMLGLKINSKKRKIVVPAQCAAKPTKKNSSSSAIAAMHHIIPTVSVLGIEFQMDTGFAWNAPKMEHIQELLGLFKTKLAANPYQDVEALEHKPAQDAAVSD